MANIHESIYAPPSSFPFPVGTSPFRQKGNGYIGDRRYLEEIIPGGYERVVDALPDEALKSRSGLPCSGAVSPPSWRSG